MGHLKIFNLQIFFAAVGIRFSADKGFVSGLCFDLCFFQIVQYCTPEFTSS